MRPLTFLTIISEADLLNANVVDLKKIHEVETRHPERSEWSLHFSGEMQGGFVSLSMKCTGLYMLRVLLTAHCYRRSMVLAFRQSREGI